MKRGELLNEITTLRGYQSYLEIGCNRDGTFQVIDLPRRVGVDPRRGGTHRMTSLLRTLRSLISCLSMVCICASRFCGMSRMLCGVWLRAAAL